jgi:hypothetical protein
MTPRRHGLPAAARRRIVTLAQMHVRLAGTCGTAIAMSDQWRLDAHD